ncbi:diadenosine tetraphosphatase and related serine/threonine protein phosphatase [Haemophilus influenzae]|uniref:Diadenosine tetraphosphatase and related serine/threonine protein phosphatase n=1 Tax=Haemophilus influenzae TaxID=727 RepID=A0A2X1PY91_HAEIF|nr:diadenosine tetraphosphatase and related serine/threonine protein phosphatase [Haemophilus influenzae]
MKRKSVNYKTQPFYKRDISMILFAGDPHGSYDHIYPFIKEQENVALIILGDLQLTTADELDKLAQHCDYLVYSW